MKNKKFTIEYSLIILISLFLLPILAESFFNHPTADDYWYSRLTHDVIISGGSFFDVIKAAAETSANFMNSWQGLYSSAFILALQPGIFTETESLYFLTTWILVFLLIISVVMVVRAIFRYFEIGRKGQSLAVGLLIAFFIIETMPDANQGLFWYNGAMNYMLFLTLVMINTALLLDCLKAERNIIIRYIIIVLLGFVIGGGNHLTAVLQVALAVLFLLFTFWKRKKYMWGNLTYLLITILGLVINLTAKGTQARRSSLDYQGNFVKTIILSVAETNRQINGWIGVSLILLCVLCCILCGKEVIALKDSGIFRWLYALAMAVISYGIICLLLCIPYYAMGTWGEGRLTNIVYAVFVILFLVNVMYLMGCLQCNLSFVLPNTAKIFLAVAAILYIGVFGNVVINSSTSIHSVLALVNGSAKQYDSELTQRISIINENAAEAVEVPPLTVYPHNLYFEDIDYNTDNYKNEWTAQYYHKESIVLLQE